MNRVKGIAGIFITLIVVCNGQFLTPDQLREQEELGYGARTHYELTGGRRTDLFRRINPDYLLRGFFPFWSIVLIALALAFITIAAIGFIGYLLGCRRPSAEEICAKEFEQLRSDNEALLNGADLNNQNDIGISPNQDFDYRSSPFSERTRIAHAGEDMV